MTFKNCKVYESSSLFVRYGNDKWIKKTNNHFDENK